jgi:hypothetical protein
MTEHVLNMRSELFCLTQVVRAKETKRGFKMVRGMRSHGGKSWRFEEEKDGEGRESLLSDCCLTPIQQLSSYIIVRTS